MNTADLRRVRLYFDLPEAASFTQYLMSYTEYFMSKDAVATYIEAALKLHHDPGINPHSGKKTSAVKKIGVTMLSEPKVFWHSCPNLGNPQEMRNPPLGPLNGAAISYWGAEEIIWERPETP